MRSIGICVGTAIQRALAELGRGVWTLSLIAVSAPMFGFLGTCFGILSAFKGCAGEKGACMAATVLGVAQGICFAGLGLAVGVVAHWCYEYCRRQLEDFELEMKCASLELWNQLSAGDVRAQCLQGPSMQRR